MELERAQRGWLVGAQPGDGQLVRNPAAMPRSAQLPNHHPWALHLLEVGSPLPFYSKIANCVYPYHPHTTCLGTRGRRHPKAIAPTNHL